jgi:hypothetical protein
MPPAARIAWIPSAPSEPVPDSTMPIARGPISEASERKKVSTDGFGPSSVPRSLSRPPCETRLAFGGVM